MVTLFNYACNFFKTDIIKVLFDELDLPACSICHNFKINMLNLCLMAQTVTIHKFENNWLIIKDSTITIINSTISLD